MSVNAACPAAGLPLDSTAGSDPAGRPVTHPLPLVEVNGIEPMTSCLQSRRSPN
jgi:hypothetical protein